MLIYEQLNWDYERTVLEKIRQPERELSSLEGRVRWLPAGSDKDDCWSVISQLWHLHSTLWKSTQPFRNCETGELSRFEGLIDKSLEFIRGQMDLLSSTLDELGSPKVEPSVEERNS